MCFAALSKLYIGTETLLLCFDLGTTTSAVTILYLAPQSKPHLHDVQKWPGCEHDSMVPTLVAYDARGSPVAYGAQCLEDDIQQQIEDGALHLAKWFKLHLHPKATRPATEDSEDSDFEDLLGHTFEIPDLPPNTSIESIYGHFMKFLYDGAKKSFVDSRFPGADKVWTSCSSSMEFIVAHPDGWDNREQNALRKAMDLAGLVKAQESRITFIKESEASVHYALKRPDVAKWMKPGAIFTLADLGGSTTDTGLYKCETITPTLQIVEVKETDCVQAGGVHVDRKFQKLVESRLIKSTEYNNVKTISKIVKDFEKVHKRLYRGDGMSVNIKFAGSKEEESEVGITSGRFMVTDNEMDKAFEFCLNEILWSIEHEVNGEVSHILLTGGVSASPYIRAKIASKFTGKHIVHCDEPGRKAVAEGAALAWFTRALSARPVRHTIGTDVLTYYNADKADHLERSHRMFRDYDGHMMIKGGWSTLVEKGTILRIAEPVPRYFELLLKSKEELGNVEVTLYSLRDADNSPEWFTDSNGNPLPGFSKRCLVSADLAPMRDGLVARYNGTSEEATQSQIDAGNVYWEVNCSLELFLAETSLRANLCWLENGDKKEGPATVVCFDAVQEGDFRRRRMAPENLIRGSRRLSNV